MASCLPTKLLQTLDKTVSDLVLEFLLKELYEEVDADPDLKERLEKKYGEAADLHLHSVWLERKVAADLDFKVWLEQKVAREEKS